MIILTEQQSKNRDFICPCGKGYFSYAALFTHIKQKHEGKAPGQIIKPKPENKRGRPRKIQPTSSPERKCQENFNVSEKTSAQTANTINLNHVNTNIKIINSISPLKSTPGSQFKHYKADQSQIPTTNELSIPPTLQNFLLDDLSRNLVRTCPQKFLDLARNQIQAAKILDENQQKSQLIECLQEFLKFCQEGLSEENANQIELLIIILLQHVFELREMKSFQGLSHIHLNDYIESFFQNLQGYIKRWKLESEPIFLRLNPMKTLVVLYNWINVVYCNSVKNEESLSLGSIKSEQMI